ncbi:MAG: (2Fe-2S)-binding protein, partial [Methanogenium sp.]|nr:(2Fe-2S)-binding protein [Methanogenium sp.]
MDKPNETVMVSINGERYQAEEGETVLSVAMRNNIEIPHLCYDESLEPYGACRLCMVEVTENGEGVMTTSCTLHATEGLTILTDTPEIEKHRKMLFELYLAEAPGSEKIKEMAAHYGVTKTRFFKKIDPTDPLGNKCILCGLCVRVCNEVMGAGAINFINRGAYTTVNTPFFEEIRSDMQLQLQLQLQFSSDKKRDRDSDLVCMPHSICMGCGACAEVCPTDAIRIEDHEGERIMKSWSNTRIRLLRCRICGRYY